MKARYINAEKPFWPIGQEGEVEYTCNPKFVLFKPDGHDLPLSHRGYFFPIEWFEILL